MMRTLLLVLSISITRVLCARTPLTLRNPLDVINDVKNDIESAQKTFEQQDIPAVFENYKKTIFDITDNDRLGNVSQQCVKSLEQLGKDISNLEHYAITLVDSWAKLESGILLGNTRWLGRYYECLNVSTDGFKGRYGGFLIGTPNEITLGLSTGSLSAGICYPDTCSDNDMNTALAPLINETGLWMGIFSTQESSKFAAKDIVAIIICVILAILVIFGTAFEFYTTLIKERELKNILYESEDFAQTVRERSKLSEIIISFSLIQNTRNLLKTTQREGDINCLHGLRFISMSWVILGHSFFFMVSLIDNPIDFADYFVTYGSFQAIGNATFSVDSFFFLSGLLVSYLGLRELTRRQGKMNVPLMYLSRYLRLTPAYAFCIMFLESLYIYLGDGPMWPSVANNAITTCQKYWWTNILYINNFIPTNFQSGGCFGWGWYLANDMQFYLIAPIFLILLHKKPLAGIITLGCGTVASIAITGALSSHYKEMPLAVGMAQLSASMSGIMGSNSNHTSGVYLTGYGNLTTTAVTPTAPPTLSSSDAFWSDLYAKPWCRVSVYFIGMATGYLIYHYKNQRMNKIFVIVMWILTTIVGLSVIYGLCEPVLVTYQMDVGPAAFYNAVSRPLWAMSLAWLTFACVNGYGGPINSFLSWKAFIPLSRLTYCAYLVHPMIIWWLYANRETLIHFEINIIISYFLALLVLANAVAYLVSMLVEAPFMGILKVLFPKKQTKDQERIMIISETDESISKA